MLLEQEGEGSMAAGGAATIGGAAEANGTVTMGSGITYSGGAAQTGSQRLTNPTSVKGNRAGDPSAVICPARAFADEPRSYAGQSPTVAIWDLC